MGLFKRILGRAGGVPEWARFMGREEYEAFLQEVRGQLTGMNFANEVDPVKGIVRLTGPETGHTLYLLNIAQVCHQAPRADWPALISTFLDSNSLDEQGMEALGRLGSDFEGARSMLKVRLYPAEDQLLRLATYRKPMDDVIAALVYDLPDKVVVVDREHVAGWGRPVDELFDVAASNVKANDPIEVEQVELTPTASLMLLSAQHHFAATHALFLGDYLGPGNKWGALVAVPHRHAVVVYPIVDQNVVVVINSMIPIAHGMYQEGPGSISPHLYWWRGGEFLHLPSRVTNKEIEFSPPDVFIDMLNQFMS